MTDGTERCPGCGSPDFTIEHFRKCEWTVIARRKDVERLYAVEAENAALRKVVEAADLMRERLHDVDGSGAATIYFAAARAELAKLDASKDGGDV